MTTDEILRLLRLAEAHGGQVTLGRELTGEICPTTIAALCRANLRLVAMKEAVNSLPPKWRHITESRAELILASMEKQD